MWEIVCKYFGYISFAFKGKLFIISLYGSCVNDIYDCYVIC